jgi:hypothetical protein
VQKKSILNKNIQGESGQAMFEFLLVLVFALGITFLFVYMSINFTIGYLNHYATFMASRTFLTSDNGSNTAAGAWGFAQNEAKRTYEKYKMDVFDVSISNLKFYKSGTLGSNAAIFVGVSSEFEKHISPYKMVGGAEKATFYSESFLGKEPVRSTCHEQVCQAIGESGCDGNSGTLDVVLFDNGC